MSEDKVLAPQDDDWTERAPTQSELDLCAEYKSLLEPFCAGIGAKLDAITKEIEIFGREYGDATGMDVHAILDAAFFVHIRNRMVEIGRQALMSAYRCGGLQRLDAPVPITSQEAVAVMWEAMALYGPSSEGMQEGTTDPPSEADEVKQRSGSETNG